MPLFVGLVAGLSIVILAGWLSSSVVSAESALNTTKRWLSPIGAVALSLAAVSVAAASSAAWLMMFGLGLRASGVTVAGLAAIAAVVAWRRRSADKILAALAQQWQEERWLVVTVVVFNVLVLSYVVLTLMRFGDMSWDAWWYHNAAANGMIQADGLYDMPMLVPWVHYAGLSEMQGSYLGLALGDALGFSLIQAPYALLFFTVIGTAAAKRHGGWAGVVMVATLLAVPSVWPQLFTAYVDVAVAAMLGMAAIALLAAWQARSPCLFFTAAILLGAIPATKPFGIAASVAVVAALVGSLRSGLGAKRVAVVVLLMAIPATPFLTRNLIEHENPFYPVETALWAPGDGLSTEEMRSFSDRTQRPLVWRDMSSVEVFVQSMLVFPTMGEGGLEYDARFGGLGLMWLAVVGLGLVTMVVDRRRVVAQHLSLIWLIALASITWALLPAAWWPRFAVAPGGLVLFGFLLVIRPRIVPVLAVAALTMSASMVFLVEWDPNRASVAETAITATIASGYETALTNEAERLVVVGGSPASPGILWGTEPGARIVEESDDLVAVLTENSDALVLVRSAALQHIAPDYLVGYERVQFVDLPTSELLEWLIPTHE